jgi:hypothetical protein
MLDTKAKQQSAFILALTLGCHLLVTVSTLADEGQQFIVPFHHGTIQAQSASDGQVAHVVVRATTSSGRLLSERSVALGGFDFRAFAVDHQGNLFLCGFVADKVTFGVGTETLTVDNGLGSQIGVRTLAVAKLDADGSALWVNTVSFPNFERTAGLVLDTVGNAYVIWTCDGPDTCVLQTASQEVTLPRLGSFATAVLARFSRSGELDWLRRIGNAEATQLGIERKQISVSLRGIRWLETQTTVTLLFETPDAIITGPTVPADSEATALYDVKGTLISVQEPPPPPPEGGGD